MYSKYLSKQTFLRQKHGQSQHGSNYGVSRAGARPTRRRPSRLPPLPGVQAARQLPARPVGDREQPGRVPPRRPVGLLAAVASPARPHRWHPRRAAADCDDTRRGHSQGRNGKRRLCRETHVTGHAGEPHLGRQLWHPGYVAKDMPNGLLVNS